MSSFELYKGDKLSLMANKYGTPLFIFNEPEFQYTIKEFKSVWEKSFPKSNIYLSYKTNYLPQLCSIAHKLGLGADVVSGYELIHALKLCHTPESIVFNGPLKRPSELRLAIENGVKINIDLLEEADEIAEIKKILELKSVKVGLRVNPCLPVLESNDPSFNNLHKSKQVNSKFGWPINSGQAKKASEKIRSLGLELTTIHCHLNSQITNEKLLIQALEPVLDFVYEQRLSGVDVEEINIGGGFGVPGLDRSTCSWLSSVNELLGAAPFEEKDTIFNLNEFCHSLTKLLNKRGLMDLTISCEPGRYLVSSSTSLLTKVFGTKETENNKWLIVDAGIHIMPTAAFGEMRKLRFFESEREYSENRYEMESVTVGGPLCFEGDILFRAINVPKNTKVGDLILISDAGAYTLSRSTNFNQPRAAAVSVNKDNIQIIWKRESYDDIFSFASK